MAQSTQENGPLRPTVLVTGACGFVASHILLQLHRSGKYNVRGTVKDLKAARCAHIDQICPGIRLYEAELTDLGAYDEPLRGVDYVIHTASPIVLSTKHPLRDILQPAVRGVLNILEACRKSGSVRRLVLTSSRVTTAPYPSCKKPGESVTEADWNADSNLRRFPYAYAKTMQERAAWDYVERLNQDPSEHHFDMVTLHPDFVIGPVLCKNPLGDAALALCQMMSGRLPVIPMFSVGVSDVRDVARAHILAMESPHAKGNRYLVMHQAKWLVELSRMLRPHYPQYPVCNTKMWDWLSYAYEPFDWRVDKNYLRNCLRIPFSFCTDKIQNELNLKYTDLLTTLMDSVESYIAYGFLQERRKGKVQTRRRRISVASVLEAMEALDHPEERKRAASISSSPPSSQRYS